MDMYSQYVEYLGKANAVRDDILRQIEAYKGTVGDVAEAYKKVILDKCFHLARLQGQFYNKQLKECVAFQELIEQSNPQMTPNQWERLISSISVAR